MLLFIPYEINSLKQRWPIANWTIIGATIVISLMALGSFDPDTGFDEPYASLILNGWNPEGMIGYIFLHAGFLHLAGNMLFLWVFGNAICSNMNNFLYAGVYLLLGILAAVTHLLFDGNPAIGASGAVNGIIGLALTVYPRDEVSVFYLFIVKGGTFVVRIWLITLIWLGFDIWGASTGGGSVAYFAHIGGFAAGVVTGLVLLHFDKIDLTELDGRTLLEILKREEIG